MATKMTEEEKIEKYGAKCDDCGQRMLVADGCTIKYYEFPDGEVVERIPYGGYGESTSHRCHDCGAKGGHYHHPGCDNERCPRCGGQAIGCECTQSDEEKELWSKIHEHGFDKARELFPDLFKIYNSEVE